MGIVQIMGILVYWYPLEKFSIKFCIRLPYSSIKMLYPRDNVLIVPCENVRFRKSDIRFFIAYFSKENLDVRGHYSDEF